MPTDVNSFVVDNWVTVVSLSALVDCHLILYLCSVQCKNNNLFKGVRLNGDDDPRPSAFLLVQPNQDFHHFTSDSGGSEFITMYTERGAMYVKQGWTQASVSVSTPWYIRCSHSIGM